MLLLEGFCCVIVVELLLLELLFICLGFCCVVGRLQWICWSLCRCWRKRFCYDIGTGSVVELLLLRNTLLSFVLLNSQ